MDKVSQVPRENMDPSKRKARRSSILKKRQPLVNMNEELKDVFPQPSKRRVSFNCHIGIKEFHPSDATGDVTFSDQVHIPDPTTSSTSSNKERVLRSSRSPQVSRGDVKASTPLSQSKSHSRMSLAFNRLSIIPTELNSDTESFTSPLVQGGGINELHNIPNKEITEDSVSLRKDYPSNEQFEDPNNQDMELTCTFMHPKDQQCIKEEDFTIYEDQSSSIPPQPDNPPNVQHGSSGVNTAVDMSLDLSCFSSPKAPVDVIHTRMVELKDESREWHSSNMPSTCPKSDSNMSFTCADPLQSLPTQGNVSSMDSNMSLTYMNNQGVSAAVPQHDDKSKSSETCASPLPQRDVKSQSTGVRTETQQRCVCTESSRVENTCKISDVMPLPPQDKSASSSQSYSIWAIDSHEHSNAVKEGNEEGTGAEMPDSQFPSMSIVPPLTVSVVDRKAVEAGSHWEPHTAKESIIVGKPPVKSCIPRLGLTRQSHGRMKQSRQQRRLALPHSLSSTKLLSLIHNSITASTLQHSLNAVVTGNTSNGAMNQSAGSKKDPSASGTNLHEDNEASLVSIQQDKPATSVGQQQNKTPSLLGQQQNERAKLSDQQQNETATVVGGQQNETVTSFGQYHYETAKSIGQQQQHGPVQVQNDSLHAPVLDRSKQVQSDSLHAPVLDRSKQVQSDSLHAPILDKSKQMQSDSLHVPILDRSEQMQNNSLHPPVLDRSEQMQSDSLHAPVLDRNEQVQSDSLHAPVLDRSEQMQSDSLHAPVLDRSEQMQNNSLHVSCSDTSSVPDIVVCDKAHTNSTASLSADGDTRSVTSIREFADSVPSLNVTADEPPKVQTSIRKKLRGSLNRTYDISPESSNLLPVAPEGTDNESLHRPLANQHPDNDGFDLLSKNSQFMQQDEEISLVASSTCSEDDSRRELEMSQEEVGGCKQTANPRKEDESKLSLICTDDLPALKNSTMTATNRRSPVQKSRDSRLVCPEDKEANTTDTAVDMEEQTLPCISSVKQQETVSCPGVKNTGSLLGSNFLSPVSRRRSARSLPSTPGSEFQSFVLTPNTTVALKDDSEEDSEESFKPYEHLTMETALEYFSISRDQINSLTKLECLSRLISIYQEASMVLRMEESLDNVDHIKIGFLRRILGFGLHNLRRLYPLVKYEEKFHGLPLPSVLDDKMHSLTAPCEVAFEASKLHWTVKQIVEIRLLTCRVDSLVKGTQRKYKWKLYKWSKHKMCLYFFTPVVGIALKITPTKELGMGLDDIKATIELQIPDGPNDDAARKFCTIEPRNFEIEGSLPVVIAKVLLDMAPKHKMAQTVS